MKRNKYFAHSSFIAHCGFILAASVALVLGGSMTAQSQTQSPAQSQTMTSPQDRDDSLNRRQLQSLDNFLDSHPEISEQLHKDPSLINNKEFVENHPDLQQYLQQHPEIREQVSENPNGSARQEERFDRREDRDRDRDRIANRPEMAAIDRFMDSHPEISEQVRKDPSLVNNRQFVENHPALQQFLTEHPGIRADFKENANNLMTREDRYDRLEDRGRDRDVTRQELANMDRFMDGHPEIAEQLHKDPSLVNNKKFVDSHPALQQFLADHPGVREEYKENPNAFMNQENRYDRRQDSNLRRDRDVTRGELASFNGFLEDHNAIAGELSKNPSLAKNEEYLANHPELREYLKSNPKVHEELSENPQTFMQSAQQLNSHTTAKVGQSKQK
jgi:phage-related protein